MKADNTHISFTSLGSNLGAVCTHVNADTYNTKNVYIRMVKRGCWDSLLIVHLCMLQISKCNIDG